MEEVEVKWFVNELVRWEEVRIRKEIEEKEFEEVRVMFVEVEKWKGKKGKKGIMDGVSVWCFYEVCWLCSFIFLCLECEVEMFLYGLEICIIFLFMIRFLLDFDVFEWWEM